MLSLRLWNFKPICQDHIVVPKGIPPSLSVGMLSEYEDFSRHELLRELVRILNGILLLIDKQSSRFVFTLSEEFIRLRWESEDWKQSQFQVVSAVFFVWGIYNIVIYDIDKFGWEWKDIIISFVRIQQDPCCFNIHIAIGCVEARGFFLFFPGFLPGCTSSLLSFSLFLYHKGWFDTVQVCSNKCREDICCTLSHINSGGKKKQKFGTRVRLGWGQEVVGL